MLEIENELAALASELVVDYGRLDRGIITEATYVTVKDEKEHRRRKLEDEQSSLRLANATHNQLLNGVELFDQMDTSQRRHLMSSLIKRIEIRKVPARGGRRNILNERRITVQWEVGGKSFMTYGAMQGSTPVLTGRQPADW
ncbi:hypothetical protein ABC337_13805 [Arthrobacter sp. 1P04PC]|uniref:hypothetical protein n=1 Tax=unclassified Arthrobacter TaxID=235627 RepID=UPI0039A274C5